MGPGAIALHLMPLEMRWGPKPLVNVVIAPCMSQLCDHRSLTNRQSDLHNTAV